MITIIQLANGTNVAIDKYLGHHNGTVRGKSFEGTRRDRKTHSERKAEIVSRSLAANRA